MPERKNELIDLAVTIVGETEKAYKIDAGMGTTCWIPKSQCEFDPETNILTLPTWLAEEKEII